MLILLNWCTALCKFTPRPYEAIMSAVCFTNARTQWTNYMNILTCYRLYANMDSLPPWFTYYLWHWLSLVQQTGKWKRDLLKSLKNPGYYWEVWMLLYMLSIIGSTVGSLQVMRIHGMFHSLISCDKFHQGLCKGLKIFHGIEHKLLWVLIICLVRLKGINKEWHVVVVVDVGPLCRGRFILHASQGKGSL